MWRSQSVCLSLVKARSMSSRVRLVRSDWPSVSGWNAVDMPSLVPVRPKRLCQKLLAKRGSRSDIILLGRPW